MDLKFYLSIFLRRLPYFLVFLVLGSAAGLSLATVLPAVYRAQAVMIVESEQIPDELASSTVDVEATEQMQIIQQRLLTRETLLDMADRLGIYAGLDDAPRIADDRVSDLRSRIDVSTRGGESRRGPREATIVRVTFEAPEPAMAARVTNELVTLILQENVEMRTTVSSQTLDFFDGEVNRLGETLARLDARILSFQEENLDALPDSLDFRRSRQAALQERLVNLEREEAALRDRRARLEDLFERTGSIASLQPVRALTPEEERLRRLRDEYASSVAVLSLENPRVAVMRAQIEALEGIVTEQRAAAGAVSSETGEALSEFDLQVAEIDAQIDFIAAQRTQIEEEMAELQRTIEATPGNAVTLEGLRRDYANVQAQYNQAVANRARADTGNTIEALSKGQRITVVEQAVAPRDPVRPNRTMVAAAGIGGGLALGLGFVLLLELLNSAVRRPADLVSKLEITPIATIPYMRTTGQVARRRATIAAVLLAIAVGIPAGLWFVDARVMPLDPALERVGQLIGVDLAGLL
jgi:uncharacterized protein involved in exopolysaccharide biosynthesis